MRGISLKSKRARVTNFLNQDNSRRYYFTGCSLDFEEGSLNFFPVQLKIEKLRKEGKKPAAGKNFGNLVKKGTKHSPNGRNGSDFRSK